MSCRYADVPGILYLLPCPISESPVDAVLPAEVVQVARETEYFLAESSKSARAFLKQVGYPRPLRETTIIEIGHRPDDGALTGWLQPIVEGSNGALVSEAGCPAIADPGATIVAAAHVRGIRVRPLVGPSSLLLAVMASGLNGQSFRFVGYLPIATNERTQALRRLERESRVGESQLFIETPYRSGALFDTIVSTCYAATRLSVAIDLTGPDEYIKTHAIADWRGSPVRPPFDRRPAVFLLLA